MWFRPMLALTLALPVLATLPVAGRTSEAPPVVLPSDVTPLLLADVPVSSPTRLDRVPESTSRVAPFATRGVPSAPSPTMQIARVGEPPRAAVLQLHEAARRQHLCTEGLLPARSCAAPPRAARKRPMTAERLAALCREGLVEGRHCGADHDAWTPEQRQAELEANCAAGLLPLRFCGAEAKPAAGASGLRDD